MIITENRFDVNNIIDSIDEINENELIYIERETSDDIIIELGYKIGNKLVSKRRNKEIKNYIALYRLKEECK